MGFFHGQTRAAVATDLSCSCAALERSCCESALASCTSAELSCSCCTAPAGTGSALAALGQADPRLVGMSRGKALGPARGGRLLKHLRFPFSLWYADPTEEPGCLLSSLAYRLCVDHFLLPVRVLNLFSSLAVLPCSAACVSS